MKLSIRLALAMGLVVLITGGVNLFLNYHSLEQGAVPVELGRMRAELRTFALDLESLVRQNSAELLSQRWSSPVIDLARNADRFDGADARRWYEERRIDLRRNWRAVLQAHSEILQIRLIDAAGDGLEVIRVERNTSNGVITAQSDDSLQPKSHRDYFKATLSLGDNQVYVSRIDLNREQHAIQNPPLPVIRLATPVHNDAANPVAILIINIDMRAIFDRFRALTPDSQRIYIIDDRGNYLVHSDPAREFGFEYGLSHRVADDFPHLREWPGSELDQTQVWEDAAGSRYGIAVVPLKLPGGPWLGLIKQVPYAQLTAAIEPVFYSSLVAAIVSFACAILLAIFLAGGLTSALDNMIKAVKNYHGKGAIRITPSGKFAEIDALGTAFESMSLELADSIAQNQRLADQFAGVVEHSPSGILIVDEQGCIRLANPRLTAMFGYRREQMIGLPVENLVPERFRKNHEGLRKGFLWSREPRQMGVGRDLFALRLNGSEFPVEIALTPYESDEGSMILVTVIDITERKRSEQAIRESLEEKEVLLKEVYHRVKNNLEIISSLLSLQEMQVSDGEAREALRDSSARVKSMSLVHNMLYQAEQYTRIDVHQYLDTLIREFRSSHGKIAREIEVTTDFEALSMSISKTIPLGLLVNELLSNSFRYAFPDGQLGRVDMSLKREGDELKLEVSDNGIGIPEDFDIETTGSLGFTLVRALTEQLDGSLRIERKDGTKVTIRFAGD